MNEAALCRTTPLSLGLGKRTVNPRVSELFE